MRAGQPCEWMGVVCETGPWPRNVRKITLIDNDLGGSIPGELSFLSELEELILENTASAGYFRVIEGFLPSPIGNLENLKVLRISGHEIKGSIPLEYANLRSLEILDLNNNLLDSRIPEGLGNLERIQEIDLSTNAFNGFIPRSFGSLSSLQKLDLGSNDLVGPIPTEMGQLTELRILDLQKNDLAGAIPASLGTLPNLISLTLTDNNLVGPPPPSVIKLASEISICSLPQKTTQFCIPDTPMYRPDGQDALCGVPLEASCSFCSSSQTSGNATCNSLESIFYNTGGIEWTNLTGWLATSNPCDWYGVDCTDDQVSGVRLANNNLAGDIPEEVGLLTGLNTIDLSNNFLTGPIPLSVAMLQGSTDSCNLAGNDIGLCIPDDPGIESINGESICGVPRQNSCNASNVPGTFAGIESRTIGTSKELTWRATRRISDAHFEVERKENGQFIVIGIVDTPSSEDPQFYSFPLQELAAGIHTFRIHMTSPSGASLYSDALEITTSSSGYFLEPPFPNPTVGTASVRFVVQEAEEVSISLYDISGRKIEQVYKGNPDTDIVQEATVSTDNLASGVYFLRLEANGTRETQTLVVQK